MGAFCFGYAVIVGKEFVSTFKFFQHFARDGDLMHFGRAIGQADVIRIDQPVGKGHFRGQAQRTMQMQGAPAFGDCACCVEGCSVFNS